MPRWLVKHYFWRISAFRWVDEVKKITLTTAVGTIQSTEGLDRNRKAEEG